MENRIEHLHRAWSQVHTRLREQEQRLSSDIAAYAKGRGARPTELMKEVERMRAECSKRFQALMEAVREQSPGK